MFGLSFTHLLILAVLAIVFIGPEQLPEVARTFARLLNEWRRTSSELQSSLTRTLREDIQPLVPPPVAPEHPTYIADHPAEPVQESTAEPVSDPEKKS